MSLIEKALGKIRENGQENRDNLATIGRRRVVRGPVARVAPEPQLQLTPQIQERLGMTVVPEHAHQRASEFRHIKRQVLDEMRANMSGRVLLVVSALSSDGKSYTSANLARSLAAEPDFTVLLVDGDAVKPALSAGFGVVDRLGLMDALADSTRDVESLVITTDVEGLSVLPAGSASEYATEYFASDRMQQVMDRLLSVPNRIVLIDSLPLLQTTEARALVPLASQVLLVVRAEVTPQAAVREALQLVGKQANLKVVLNDMPRTRLSRYMGYGYTYDYANGK